MSTTPVLRRAMLTVGSFGPHIYAWIRVSSEFPGLRENVKSPESRSYIRGFCDVLCGNEGKVVWWGWSSGGEEYPPARTLHTSPARTLSCPPGTLHSPPGTQFTALESPTYSSHESPTLESPTYSSREEYPPARTLQSPLYSRVPHVLFT